MIGAPRLLPLVFTQLYRGLSMAIIAVSFECERVAHGALWSGGALGLVGPRWATVGGFGCPHIDR
jgi:hypothetical protein